MTDEHDCTATLTPLIDDAQDGEPILSATIGDGEAIVYLECADCGREFEATYEYVSTDPVA